jgi:hypothetical protein
MLLLRFSFCLLVSRHGTDETDIPEIPTGTDIKSMCKNLLSLDKAPGKWQLLCQKTLSQ